MKNEKLLAAVLGVTAAMGITGAAHAQVNYGTAGSTYLQNFDTLPSVPNAPPNNLGTWTDNSTLPGWYAAAGNTFGFRVDDGRSNAGGVYSFGATSPDPNPGERALGSISSGTSLTNFYGVRLVNTTGTTLDKFTLTYTGEQWRETTAIQNFLTFGYSTTATAVQSGTYTSVGALDFGAIRYGGVGGATADVKTNGNTAPYQAAKTATVRIFNGGWAPGAELWLRFSDGDSTGSDQGLAIDDFNFSAITAPTATNNSTLSVGGSKAPAAVNVGRVVRSFSSATTSVNVSNAGLDNTSYFADSPDGATATLREGTVTAGGNVALNVGVGAGVTGPALAGTDVTSNVYVQNTGNSGDADVIIPVTAHVVQDRFVNTSEGTAGLDFGKMLVGSSKSLTGTLTTTNTGLAANDANHLVVVKVAGSTTASGTVGSDAYANVTMAAGTDQVFADGTETTQRMITVTPTRSGDVVPGGGGGVRFPSFINYDLQLGDTETAVGANLAGRIYVRGDFYRSALLSGDTGPVLSGSNATVSNAPAPTGTAGDGNVGKRAAARMTAVSFNQSGWTAGGFGVGLVLAGTGSTASSPPTTVQAAISLSPAGKLNGQYDATLVTGWEHNDQTIHGTAANDLGTVNIPVRGTVSDTVGTHAGTYSLDGGSLTAGNTDLTGTFTQTGGTSTFGTLGGTGANVTVGAGASLTADHVRGASLSVDGTATIRPNGGAAGMTIVNTLTVGAGGKLDLADNDLIVDYSGTSPEGAIRQRVKDARVTGSTSGIFSTPGNPDDDKVLAVADNTAWGKSAFNGVNIDTDTVVGKYTYFGDANLDGKVTGDDYLNVDANLGTGDSWLEGDFNMSGVTTGDDYLAIDANLGKGTADPLAFAELKEEMVAAHVAMFGEEYLVKLAEVEAEGFGSTVVPEPAAISLIGLGALGLLGRRRRRA